MFNNNWEIDLRKSNEITCCRCGRTNKSLIKILSSTESDRDFYNKIRCLTDEEIIIKKLLE